MSDLLQRWAATLLPGEHAAPGKTFAGSRELPRESGGRDARGEGVCLRAVHRAGGLPWVSQPWRRRPRFFDRLWCWLVVPAAVAVEGTLFVAAFLAAAADDFIATMEGAD